MTKKVSIIVPIYNASKTLRRTLDSILNQSYNNLEIILVNDGSTDDSLNICNEYKKIDSRIIIKNESNKGVSASRNIGLDNMTGDYVVFIDSDDTINADYIYNLLKTAIKTNADIVCSKINCIVVDKAFSPYPQRNNNPIYSKQSFLKMFLNFQVGSAVWGKIYKKSIIGDIKFQDLKINEDFIFCWDVIKNSQLFSETPDAIYNYYLNNEKSLSKANFSMDNMSMINHIDSVKEYILLNFTDLLNDANNYYSACLLHMLISYYNYLCSSDKIKLYLDEKEEMVKRAKVATKIKNYFLISEREMDLDSIVYKIENKIKKMED